MTQATEKIGNQVEIEYGTRTLHPTLSGVNHWEGGANIRDYLDISNQPRELVNAYVDVSGNARIYSNQLTVDTDCGHVVIDIMAGGLSGAKKDAIKEMISDLLS